MSEVRSLALAYDLAIRHGDGEIVTAILQAAGEWLAVRHQRDAALDLLRRLVAFEEPDSLLDQEDDPRLREERQDAFAEARALLSTLDGTTGHTTEKEG